VVGGLVTGGRVVGGAVTGAAVGAVVTIGTVGVAGCRAPTGTGAVAADVPLAPKLEAPVPAATCGAPAVVVVLAAVLAEEGVVVVVVAIGTIGVKGTAPMVSGFNAAVLGGRSVTDVAGALATRWALSP
jgi:hypothetical protein